MVGAHALLRCRFVYQRSSAHRILCSSSLSSTPCTNPQEPFCLGSLLAGFEPLSFASSALPTDGAAATLPSATEPQKRSPATTNQPPPVTRLLDRRPLHPASLSLSNSLSPGVPATYPHCQPTPVRALSTSSSQSAGIETNASDSEQTQGVNHSGNPSNPQHGSPHGPHSASHSPKEEETQNQDPASSVLEASLPFVLECGWTEAAMLEGARAAGMSPAILSLFPRREAHLVEFFMDQCRHKFEEESRRHAPDLETTEDLGRRLEMVVRMRLEQQALYTSTWAQALSIQALPGNLSHTAQQRMQLIAALWGAAGERTRSDLESRALCAMLSAVYTATELFMLTDFSAGYEDTWQFLNRRMSEGLQAYAGLSAAQDQVLKMSKELFHRLGIQPPSGVPFAGLDVFAKHSGTDKQHGSHGLSGSQAENKHSGNNREPKVESDTTPGATERQHEPSKGPEQHRA